MLLNTFFTDIVNLFQQTTNILHFSSPYRNSHESLRLCYNTKFNFEVDDICDIFNCSALQLKSNLIKDDENTRVAIYLQRYCLSSY